MSTPSEIPFQDLLDALLDVETPFKPRFLYRLSDLGNDELAEVERTWPKIPDWRRKALMEDAEELGENDTLLSFEALARLALQDEAPFVRQPAIRILWEYESSDLPVIFLNLLRTDNEPQVRAAAATALGKYVYLGEIEELSAEQLIQIEDALLQAATGTDDLLVQRRALEALGYSSREEVPALIEAAYNSGERDWLVSALFAMGRSAHEVWFPNVLDMLENNQPVVRAEAARAAGELEIDEAVPQLIELLDDPNDDVREASIWSLSQIGGEGVREILEKLYDETEDDKEADFIDDALDNLAFNEENALFALFDVPDIGSEEDHRRENGDDSDVEDEFFDLIEEEDEDEDIED
jgi:HEAT repeat protein